MSDRQRWFAKAWSIWGDRGKPDVPPAPAGIATPTAIATGGGVIGAGMLSDPVGLSSTLVSLKGNTGQLLAGVNLSGLIVPALILAAFLAAAWFLGRKNV